MNIMTSTSFRKSESKKNATLSLLDRLWSLSALLRHFISCQEPVSDIAMKVLIQVVENALIAKAAIINRL